MKKSHKIIKRYIISKTTKYITTEMITISIGTI